MMNMQSYRDYATVVLRCVFGFAFVLAAINKILNYGVVTGMFQGFFGSAGTVLTVATIIIELFGGIFLLLGIWTRIASALLAVVMVVAFIVTFKVTSPGLIGALHEIFVMNVSGSNIVVNVAYFAALISLVFSGTQKWAILPDR